MCGQNGVYVRTTGSVAADERQNPATAGSMNGVGIDKRSRNGTSRRRVVLGGVLALVSVCRMRSSGVPANVMRAFSVQPEGSGSKTGRR